MSNKISGMTRNIWPYSEVQAHWEEIMQLAAGGEPQRITRPDGVVLKLVVEPQPTEAKPFVSALAAFAGLPNDAELVTERAKDIPRDIEL